MSLLYTDSYSGGQVVLDEVHGVRTNRTELNRTEPNHLHSGYAFLRARAPAAGPREDRFDTSAILTPRGMARR